MTMCRRQSNTGLIARTLGHEDGNIPDDEMGARTAKIYQGYLDP
jgi:hypothetical protein